MLRTLCLIALLVSSTIIQANSENDSIAHRAFWWSENGQPILDGNGQCIRNGSWEALGQPTCIAENTQPSTEVKVMLKAEPELVTEVSETQTTETEAAIVVAETVLAAPDVTYSYPVVLIITPIYFDFDKNNLRVDQQEKIELAIMKARKAYTILKVSLGGHEDSRGSDEYNYALSQRRINTTVNYLDLRDMQTDTTMAWGESKLIINADGTENYGFSRRVELVIKVQEKVAD